MSHIINGVPQLLSVTTSISLTATGNTSLFTVPTGQNIIVTEAIVYITNSSGFVSAATVSVGKAAAYTDWIGVTALTGLSGVGSLIRLSTASLLPVQSSYTGGDVIKVNVTAAAVATTLTAKIYLLGFYI